MGSDESHFNVSLIVRDKVTGQYPQTTTFEEKGEPKRIQTKVPLLTNYTGSRCSLKINFKKAAIAAAKTEPTPRARE